MVGGHGRRCRHRRLPRAAALPERPDAGVDEPVRGALRDTLRELPIADGTVLEATLAGVPPVRATSATRCSPTSASPSRRCSPACGCGTRRPGPAGVVQTYRRVPWRPIADEGDEETVLAALEVPIAGVYELDSARHVWLATRRVVVATLPPGQRRPSGQRSPCVRVSPRDSDRELGNVQLIKRLLDGIRAAFQVYAGDDLEGTAQRLAAELRADQAEMTTLLSSPRGAVLAPATGSRQPTSSSRRYAARSSRSSS